MITRLCRDCVDGACVDACPKDCIVEHRPAPGDEALPRQLFIDPGECIDCAACEPECPWEAIYPEERVPPEFAEDTALNALAMERDRGFHVPEARLRARPTAAETLANRRRWGLSR